jgi:hypothetical protein
VSEYRGEVRPRRQPTRHHIVIWSASHSHQPVSDPFPPMSSKQFPALYTRNPQKNVYRSYMRMKTPYTKRSRS